MIYLSKLGFYHGNLELTGGPVHAGNYADETLAD
jgi:hypothetical protein